MNPKSLKSLASSSCIGIRIAYVCKKLLQSPFRRNGHRTEMICRAESGEHPETAADLVSGVHGNDLASELKLNRILVLGSIGMNLTCTSIEVGKASYLFRDLSGNSRKEPKSRCQTWSEPGSKPRCTEVLVTGY